MGRLFIIKEVTTPDDVRGQLADPERHWKEGYSALELARSWLAHPDGLPSSIQHVLDSYSLFAGAELVEAFFEKKVELGTPGRPSQNDVLAYCVTPTTSFVAAVEGKVKEPFGPYIHERAPDPSRDPRVTSLCEQLGISIGQVVNIRYQLIHRAVSALREARRYRAPNALLLVHSFDIGDASLGDYQAFAEIMGCASDQAVPNRICASKLIDGIQFHIGWIREVPTSSRGFPSPMRSDGTRGDSWAAFGQATEEATVSVHETGPTSPRKDMPADDPLAHFDLAVRHLVERIRTAPRSRQAKKKGTVSSNVSSGFKKATRGEDYKMYYDQQLRGAIAELGAYSGVQISLLVELAVLLRNRTSADKRLVVDLLSANLR